MPTTTVPSLPAQLACKSGEAPNKRRPVRHLKQKLPTEEGAGALQQNKPLRISKSRVADKKHAHGGEHPGHI